MKKLLVILALMMPVALFAQSDSEKKLTKFEQFTSKTGRISKFVDRASNLMSPNAQVRVAETY